MPTLLEAIENHLRTAQQERQPPPQFMIDQHTDYEPAPPLDIDAERSVFTQSLAGAMGVAKNVFVRPLLFAAEGLQNVDSMFRDSILTAAGRLPLDEYPQRVKEIWSGRRDVSGVEFNELLIGEAAHRQLMDIPFIPGWYRHLVAPHPTIAGIDVSKTEPMVSVGRVLGLFSDVIISPFLGFAALPKHFYTATKLGRAARAVGLDPSNSPLTFPLRFAGRALVSKKTPWGAFLLHGRDPQDVLPEKIWRLLYTSSEELQDQADALGLKMVDVAGRHKALSEKQLENVWNDIHIKHGVLDPAETALRDDLMNTVIEPLWRRAERMGYHMVGEAGKQVIWEPKDKLQRFIAMPRGWSMTADVGEKQFAERMTISLPWQHLFEKAHGKALPYDLAKLEAFQKNPLYSVEAFTAQLLKKLVLEEREQINTGVGLAWVNRGFVSAYRPVSPARTANQHNPELLALDEPTWRYFVNKFHDFTGHRAGKFELMFSNQMEEMFGELQKFVGKGARYNRVVNYFFERSKRMDPRGFPAATRASAVASGITANVVRATLGFPNLSSTLKQMSAVVNVGATEGIWPTLKGIFKMYPMGEEAQALSTIRKLSNFKAEFNKVMFDDVWFKSGRNTLDKILLGPFSAMDMWGRGIASNAAAGAELHRLMKSGRSVQSIMNDPAAVRELVSVSRFAAAENSFVYGVAGRSHFMMNPLARVGFALQSYSWKQAEFLARSWRRDGSAVMRWVGMNGWLIDQADRIAGVNAENWLGWGFLPPQTLGRGPTVEAISDALQMTIAYANDDEELFRKHADGLRSNIREVFRTLGMDESTEALQISLQGLSLAGVLPVPVVGIGRTFKAINEFKTGERISHSGKTWQPVTRDEAMKSFFFRTHQQAEDARYLRLEADVRRTVDSELDRRVRRYVKALEGTNGDEVIEAANELSSPIGLKKRVTGELRAPGLSALSYWAGEETAFWPHPEMIERRLDNRLRRTTTSAAVVEMYESGWAKDVLWAEYSTRAMREIERGAFRPLGR